MTQASTDHYDPAPGAATAYDTPLGITNPPIDELLDRVSSKYALVIYAAKRARQINDYYNQLGDALGTVVPPQVTSTARKPLSIAFEEIDADKIEGVGGATGRPVPESLVAEAELDVDGQPVAEVDLVSVPTPDAD